MNHRNRMYALGRMKKGAMNRTESAYEQTLINRQRAGEIEWFSFEGIKLRLADKTFYTPDFAVMLTNGEMQIHEVKGFWTDDARVKIKCAAEKFPFKFIAVKSKRGKWEVEEIGA